MTSRQKSERRSAVKTNPKKSRRTLLEKSLIDAIPEPINDETRRKAAFWLASQQDGQQIVDLMSESELEQLQATVGKSLYLKHKSDHNLQKAIALENTLQHASAEELRRMGEHLGTGGVNSLRHRISEMAAMVTGGQPVDLYFGEIYIGEDMWFIDHDVCTEVYYTDSSFAGDDKPTQCFVLVNHEERRITFGGGASDPAMLGMVIVQLSVENLKRQQEAEAAKGGAA